MREPSRQQFNLRLRSCRLITAVELTNDGLMAGAETNLSRGDNRDRTDQERLKTLLSIIYRGSIHKSAINHFVESVSLWDRGDKVLAQIRLAFARLPKLDSAEDAYRLFLAELALAQGIKPRNLLEELSLSIAPKTFEKFDPSQARVPSGEGPTGGQWSPDRTFPSSPSITTYTIKPLSAETAFSPIRSKPHENAGTIVFAASGGLEARCEAQYDKDIFQCRMVGLRACYAQAAQRYAACLSGAQIPPFNY